MRHNANRLIALSIALLPIPALSQVGGTQTTDRPMSEKQFVQWVAKSKETSRTASAFEDPDMGHRRLSAVAGKPFCVRLKSNLAVIGRDYEYDLVSSTLTLKLQPSINIFYLDVYKRWTHAEEWRQRYAVPNKSGPHIPGLVLEEGSTVRTRQVIGENAYGATREISSTDGRRVGVVAVNVAYSLKDPTLAALKLVLPPTEAKVLAEASGHVWRICGETSPNMDEPAGSTGNGWVYQHITYQEATISLPYQTVVYTDLVPAVLLRAEAIDRKSGKTLGVVEFPRSWADQTERQQTQAPVTDPQKR